MTYKEVPKLNCIERIILEENWFLLLPVLEPTDFRMLWDIYNSKEQEERNKIPVDPQAVIAEVFTVYSLEEIRFRMWQVMKYALENKAITDRKKAVKIFTSLYQQVNNLITVNYLLHMDKQPQQATDKTEHS